MKAFALLVALLVVSVAITGCTMSATNSDSISGDDQVKPEQVAQDSIDTAVVDDSDTVELGEMV